jgi:hypothetical protein
MDTETAQIVLLAITLVGAIVWMVGLQFLVSSYRIPKSRPADGVDPATDNWLTGSAEVEGPADALVTKAAAVLAKGNLFPFGPVKIVEKTTNRITFERLGPGGGNQMPARWFRRGELRIAPVRQGRSRVDWAVSNPGWPLWCGGLFLVMGLLALVAGCWVIYSYVISSPDPALRWQTIQMLQVAHFLWPPFLVSALYRRGMKEMAAQFEALACNLPYYGD